MLTACLSTNKPTGFSVHTQALVRAVTIPDPM